MKRFITGIFAATLLATSPAWAHGGGRGHGDHDERHGGKHLKHKHKHRHHHHDDVVVIQERQFVEPRVVERVTVLEPQPVVVQDPSVNIVIPLR
ncbi:MAG TPA: hypothetical protein VHP37_25325 [Burkholderiales bacterium]|nr:hypothetical protein [Burkholderiales bacterium]